LHIRHQTAGINIVWSILDRPLGESQRAADVGSFQSLAAIPQIHLMPFDPVNQISGPSQKEHAPANKKTDDRPGPSTFQGL
jgi:hypothetical protein